MAVTLRKITEADLDMISEWRMRPDITKYMNTDPVLTHEGQVKWLAKISADPDVRYWMIEVDGEPAGVINVVGLKDSLGFGGDNDIAYAYYMGEKRLRSFQTAVSLEMSLYDYAFDVLGKDAIWADVFTENRNVIKLHELCGAEIVEIKKGHVTKNGVDYDVAFLKTSKEKWYSIRAEMEYEKIEFI